MAGWPNLSELLSTGHGRAPVALVGAPLALGSVTPGACDQAPALLRRTLKRIGRYDIETGRDSKPRLPTAATSPLLASPSTMPRRAFAMPWARARRRMR
jgi:hypothetical protein